MQAPVAGAATARLAGEVSQAGGLGSLGASWTEPGVLREQIRSIGRMTDRPFCVNLVLDFEQDERLEVAVEERAPIVSFSFGLRPRVGRARAGRRRASVGTGRLAGRGASGGRCGRRRADRPGCRGRRPCTGRRGSAAAVGRGAKGCVAASACGGRDRRSGIGACRARCWRRGCRHGHPICGQRRVRRPSAVQGAPAASRSSRHGAD